MNDLVLQNAKALVAAIAMAVAGWLGQTTDGDGAWWVGLLVVILGAIATWAVPNKEKLADA